MSTQGTCALGTSPITSKSPSHVFAVPAPPRQAPPRDQDVDAKMQNLLKELRKRSSEKLALQKELNLYKTKQANFCAHNCKKRLDILNDDLRFKQKEIDAQRRRIKELESRRFDSPQKLLIHSGDPPVRLPQPPQLFAATALPRKAGREFPEILSYEVCLEVDVFVDFAQADPSDGFACKLFARWCRSRNRATSATEDDVEVVRKHLPAVFDRVVASGDSEVITALLRFLGHVQNLTKTSVTASMDWRRVLPQASRNIGLLLALTRLLSKSLDSVNLFPTLRAAICNEADWRDKEFHQLLEAILDMVLEQSCCYESVSVVKQVLRVYREVLDKDTDPVKVERMLMRALMIRLEGAPIESELVAVVTRGEAFHHLGEVLKKIIRCQPTLSYTGCPEMMEIADESFRDG